DNEAAKDQFQKLRAEQVSPESIVMIDQYLSALNLRDQWKFQGGLSFLNESNINNAPKAGTRIGNWNAWERESATGFSYFAEAEKKWSLSHNYFAQFSIEGRGKYYWDNKKYNEFNGRVGAGVGYQTARFEISLMPFTERRWYAGGASGNESMKQYSKNSGARLDLTYWLSEKWQISTALEYGEQRYTTRKHLNGNNYLWSNTLSYFPKSGQFWFVGADYNRENTRDEDNAYQRKNLRLGWGQEWGWGISTRVSLAYAHRTYKGADLFNIRQKNNEYQSAVTLWHRDLYFWGITPKITWSYQRVSSNHPFYSYDKNRIFLEMGTTF
ncbi:MAG: surface lipoprotein assembly modifier, partial [Haemophilus parainfluenzae]